MKEEEFINSLGNRKKFTKYEAKVAQRIWEAQTGVKESHCFCSQSSRDTYVNQFLNWVNNNK